MNFRASFLIYQEVDPNDCQVLSNAQGTKMGKTYDCASYYELIYRVS